MFLKVKHAAGKKYFALCESVRRDKKIVTKTIRSLGNEEKAFQLLQSDYPEYLERFHQIVGTNECRDNIAYGLWCVNECEFFRIYSSGMSYGLYFKYDSYEEAEKERKKYTISERFVVKEMPNELVLQDETEFQRRIDKMRSN